MKKLLLSLMTPTTQSSRLADAILAIPRILCGYFLAYNFGGSKFGLPWSPGDNKMGLFQVADWFPADVAEFGGVFALAPLFFAWMAAASEAIGGLFLLLGLKTRIASFLIVCTMLVAIFFQKWDDGLWGMLPAMGFLWVALYSLVLGSGRFGLDYLLTKRWRKKMTITAPTQISSLNTSIACKALGILFLLSVGVCVASPGQAEYQVTFQVDMNQREGIETVGLRGNVEPLSWEKDYLLKDENGDGIYEATITFSTKKRRIAYKYLQNGEWELDGLDNRDCRLITTQQTVRNVYDEYDFYSKEEIQQLTFEAVAIKEDLATLRKTLEFIHPNLYKYRTETELNGDFEELEESMLAVPTLTNAYKAVSRFATNIRCSHTFTNPWNQGPEVKSAFYFQPDKVPFTFKRTGMQLFVDKNASEDKRLVQGLEILSINGVLATEILSRLTQFVTSDGRNYEKRLQRLTLTGMEKFELFDIFFPLEFGSQDIFELELKNHSTGMIFSTEVKAQTKTQRTAILKSRYTDFVTDLSKTWEFKVLDEKTAYLKMLTFAIFDDSFDWKSFLESVFSQLTSQSIEHLIIDIRGNEGGNSEIVEYVMERILKEAITVSPGASYTAYRKIPEELKAHISTWDDQPYDWKNKVKQMANGKFAAKSEGKKNYKPKKDGFKGKVYLLTDAANSSATHLMATYVKQFKLATIVGEPTGGNQRGFSGGYMFFHRLPNTGIEIDIPVFGIDPFPVTADTPDGGIQPDVLVEQKVEDFVNGTDATLEAVMKIIKK